MIAPVGPVVETQEAVEDSADARDVGVDLFVGEELARLIAARWIADLGGAAAHQNDGSMAGPLQAPQQHDLYEAADVQAVGRRIEADVGGNHAGLRACVEARGIGDLVDEAALGQTTQKIGLEWTHHLKNPLSVGARSKPAFCTGSPGACLVIAQRAFVVRKGRDVRRDAACKMDVTSG